MRTIRLFFLALSIGFVAASSALAVVPEPKDRAESFIFTASHLARRDLNFDETVQYFQLQLREAPAGTWHLLDARTGLALMRHMELIGDSDFPHHEVVPMLLHAALDRVGWITGHWMLERAALIVGVMRVRGELTDEQITYEQATHALRLAFYAHLGAISVMPDKLYIISLRLENVINDDVLSFKRAEETLRYIIRFADSQLQRQQAHELLRQLQTLKADQRAFCEDYPQPE